MRIGNSTVRCFQQNQASALARRRRIENTLSRHLLQIVLKYILYNVIGLHEQALNIEV